LVVSAARQAVIARCRRSYPFSLQSVSQFINEILSLLGEPLVEDDRVAGSAVGVERIVGNDAHPIPARGRIQLLGRIASHRIEREQRKSRRTRMCFDRCHQRSSHPLPTRPPMHEEFALREDPVRQSFGFVAKIVSSGVKPRSSISSTALIM